MLTPKATVGSFAAATGDEEWALLVDVDTQAPPQAQWTGRLVTMLTGRFEGPISHHLIRLTVELDVLKREI